jgi:hypothetical protein
VEIGFELRTSCSNTMLNYRLSQKFKLLGNDELPAIFFPLVNYNSHMLDV